MGQPLVFMSRKRQQTLVSFTIMEDELTQKYH